MKKIHFKNGGAVEISSEIAKTLQENIIKGCNDWQIFSDENDNPILFVKLSEVTYID